MAIDYRAKTKEFEGFVPTVYLDSVGKRTVGYGFNIDDPIIKKMIPIEVRRGKRQMTRSEADSIFNTLYANAGNDAKKFVGDKVFNSMPKNAQASLIDMSYNLGYNKLTGFQDFRAAVINKDYKTAAAELKDSKWFNQVGRRSRYHYDVFKNTNPYTWNDLTKSIQGE